MRIVQLLLWVNLDLQFVGEYSIYRCSCTGATTSRATPGSLISLSLSIHIYIYIHTYVCMYMYVSLSLSLYIYIYNVITFILYYTILYYTILYYNILHYTILYYAKLYYIPKDAPAAALRAGLELRGAGAGHIIYSYSV